MNLQPGKKLIILPADQYERLKKKHFEIEPAEKSAIVKTDEQMRDLWNKDDIPDDEKVRIFTKQLNDFKRYYDFLMKPKPVSIEAININKDTKEERTTASDNENGNFKVTDVDTKHDKEKVHIDTKSEVNDLTKDFPKNAKVNADEILQHIKPDVLTWNERGEINYKGEILPNSDIMKLLIDVSTNRQKKKSEALHLGIFTKALYDMKLPKHLIKNNSVLDVYKAYRDESLRTPLKLLSSTSKRR